MPNTFDFGGEAVRGRLGPLTVGVSGGEVSITLDAGPLGIYRRTDRVRSYGEPIYADFEGFLRRAGDNARLAAIEYEEVGCILWFYDAGPSKPVAQADFPGVDVSECEDGGCFGYAMNLLYPSDSEWGYAPFPEIGVTPEQHRAAYDKGLEAFLEAMGGADNVVQIDARPAVVGVAWDKD